jgi:5-methylcytosine-specific restriction enzyme A
VTENLALQRPMKYGKQPGCGNRTRNEKGYCDAHLLKNATTEYQHERCKDATDKLYGCARWYRLRRMMLEQNFQCQRIIGFEQCINAARVVHHIISPRERTDLMYDPTNLAALCESCHPGGEAGTPDWKVGRDFVPTIFELPNFGGHNEQHLQQSKQSIH